MPYVPSEKTVPPAEDRKVLDPYIFALVERMKTVSSENELGSLRPLIGALSDKIKEVAEKYNYWGAFAGELNYSIHTIFLELIPDVRYWVMAISTGWQNRIGNLFNAFPLDEIEEYHEDVRDEIPFGNPKKGDLIFKHLSEWVMVRVAVRTASDNSRDSSDIISGVFRHLDTEFYRRVGIPYEDKQIVKSGDVPAYKRWISKVIGEGSYDAWLKSISGK